MEGNRTGEEDGGVSEVVEVGDSGLAGSGGMLSGVTEGELQGFLDTWVPRSACEGWDPVGVYRSWRGVREVRWCDVKRDRDLERLSRVVEYSYLTQLDRWKRGYVKKLMGNGRLRWGVERSEMEAERRLCQLELYYLVKYGMGYDLCVFHLHKGMCDTMIPVSIPLRYVEPLTGRPVVDARGCVAGHRGMGQWPRDTYKSTCRTVGFQVQQVVRDANVRILLKSNAEPNASKKMVEARNHFEKNRYLCGLFPEHVIRTVKDRGTGMWWKTPASTAVQEDGTFVAAGVGSGKASQHFNIVLGDDFWDEKSVTSAEQSSKTKRDLDLLEYLLASPAQGKIELTGTRFAYDDPTDGIRKSGRFRCVIVSGVMPNGRSVFPESLPLRVMYGQSQQNLNVFSCQVMLNPTTKDQGFKEEWFRYMTWAALQEGERGKKLRMRKVILVDASVDDKESGDPVAVVVVVIDSKGRFTVVDGVEDFMEPSMFVRTVCNMWDKWHPHLVGRQKTALETTLMSFFREENRRRQKEGLPDLRFYDYSLGKRHKKQRITASLQPRLMAGGLYLDPGTRICDQIKGELLKHPNTQEDHLIDALSMIDDPVLAAIPSGPLDSAELPDDIGSYSREDLAKEQEAQAQRMASEMHKSARGDARKTSATGWMRGIGTVASAGRSRWKR